jgi:hypothetical protein
VAARVQASLPPSARPGRLRERPSTNGWAPHGPGCRAATPRTGRPTHRGIRSPASSRSARRRARAAVDTTPVRSARPRFERRPADRRTSPRRRPHVQPSATARVRRPGRPAGRGRSRRRKPAMAGEPRGKRTARVSRARTPRRGRRGRRPISRDASRASESCAGRRRGGPPSYAARRRRRPARVQPGPFCRHPPPPMPWRRPSRRRHAIDARPEDRRPAGDHPVLSWTLVRALSATVRTAVWVAFPSWANARWWQPTSRSERHQGAHARNLEPRRDDAPTAAASDDLQPPYNTRAPPSSVARHQPVCRVGICRCPRREPLQR